LVPGSSPGQPTISHSAPKLSGVSLENPRGQHRFVTRLTGVTGLYLNRHWRSKTNADNHPRNGDAI